MENFMYYNPAKIVFGKDTEQQVGKLVKENQGSKILIVTSGDFVKQIGIWDTVVASFEAEGLDYFAFDKITPNPSIEIINEGISLAKETKINFVLAIGGGSAMDAAKAIAIGVKNDKPLWEYFKEGEKVTGALPIGVIPTLPSSGSETSNAAIVSFGQHKIGFESEVIIPKFAILNPIFTLNLPDYQTACGLADIVCHLLERYFTQTEHVTFSDFMLEGAIKSVMYNAQRLIDDPTNYASRAEIMWSATVAHNNLLDAGRVSDWASHRMEHELSAQYGVTHGEGMAVVFPAWLRYMAIHQPQKLSQLANHVFGIDFYNYTETEMATLLANEIEKYFKALGLKTTLTELGIDNRDFEEMAKRATNDGTTTIGHYLPLTIKEIVAIYHLMG